MTKEFLVNAVLKTPRTEFEMLNVEQALGGNKEEIKKMSNDSVTFSVNRSIRASNESEAREKAKNGKLLTDVPHEVENIEEIHRVSSL